MDVFDERIRPLIEAARATGTTDTVMEREIGLPAHSIYKWMKGGYKSYIKYIPQIAAYFNVSVDYLTGASDEKSPPQSDGLSDRERALIRAFRAAPKGYQDSALSLLESAPLAPQAPGGGGSAE